MTTAIALAGVGLDTYWPQFAGLRDRLVHCQTDLAGKLGSDDVRIVDLGLVDSVAAAHAAADRARREDCRMLVLWLSTYALSGVIHRLVADLPMPVVVAALQPSAKMDIPGINALGDRGAMTGEWLAYCQACSAPEVANVFSRTGIKLRMVAGHIGDERSIRRLREWSAAAAAAHRLRRSTIGMLGGYYDGMMDVHTDVTGLAGALGCRYRGVEFARLEDARASVTAADIAAMRSELARTFVVDPACSVPELNRAAATAVALDRLARDEGFDAMAYYYEGRDAGGDRDLVTSLIPGMTLLTGRGVPCAGEYEVKNATAMLIMQLIAEGGSFSEYYGLDCDDGVVLLGHDGPGHPALADGPVRLVPLPVYHGKPGKGLSIGMSVRRGPVTVLSVVQRPGGRTVLQTAQAEAVDGPTLAIGNTNSRYRFSLSPEDFVEAWSAGGPAHHCAIGTGHHAAAIGRLADILGIEHHAVC
ncbi:MAG: L-fucose/L-arabinose isomerase family protein [Planctomycetes bacterium]|nr:L-fucose/L-arabinose isomerase family protein [Planctomycetota bacterium]